MSKREATILLNLRYHCLLFGHVYDICSSVCVFRCLSCLFVLVSVVIFVVGCYDFVNIGLWFCFCYAIVFVVVVFFG